ncbi:MAG: CCA tRNA nucleotidyltransferase [Chitinispirillales bacterium]|jgi:poly(A) polymerase|nr:CCA tRNA nucleotidyltransferase [Chitinispirillales bacterium]
MHDPQTQLTAAVHIVKTLTTHGFEAYFAGGWVRDFVMNSSQKSDIDIATSATPDSIRKIFGQTIGVGEQFGVMIVVEAGIPFEVATFRSDVGIKNGRHPESVVFTNAKNDALRRDFTINGMFFNPFTEEVIDYTEGRSDVVKKVVRAIGDPVQRFSEDYLRMLRAVRFAARFGYTIEENTYSAIKDNAVYIKDISIERIFAEMSKMLLQKNPARSLELLHESSLLPQFLPEVENLCGIEQPPQFHPEGDVFIHTVKTLSFLTENPSAQLAWAALLHDIGKPPTMTVSGRIRFNNHHRVGALMAESLLRRLKAPNALIEAVSGMVDNHMNFMNVGKMRLSTLKKFLSRPTILDELELHRADCLASHGDLENYYFVKARLGEFRVEQIKPKALISGKDLIELGLKPGPPFGKILSEIYDLQLEEKITTKEEALAEAGKMIRELRT